MSDRRTVTVTIDTENAAFRDETEALDRGEVARLLREAANWIEQGASRRPLVDYNGNIVGQFDVVEYP